jgi:head-tail adaptor
MNAAQLNRRVQFQRRALTGTTLGSYANHSDAVWGEFRQLAENDERVGNFSYTAKLGVLTIRSSSFATGLGAADRVLIDSEPYEIRAVSLPDRNEGLVRIDVRGGPTRSAYASWVNRRGQTVTLERGATTATVRAHISELGSEELIAGITQAQHRVVILAEDVTSQGFPEPIRRNDGIRPAVGVRWNVERVDNWTHMSAGTLNAYELIATG